MALSRRTGQRFQASIWPGFVDAMTGLLLVLMFVLTIFMVVQSVLRETITGQETELDILAGEVAALAQALGLETARAGALDARVGELDATLAAARTTANTQAALIASLNAKTAAQQEALGHARGKISSFEAQVASLLSERDGARGQVAELTREKAEMLSDQQALELALATARREVDAGTEAARLAAAKREALQALIADLNRDAGEQTVAMSALQSRLGEEEAARMAEAAAAARLREKLAGAGNELTAMTLALEAKRREAEETLTLLAAAQSVGADLDTKLAAALLAQVTGAAGEKALREELAAALAARTKAETLAQSHLTSQETRAALLAVAHDALSREEAKSAEGLRAQTLLNQQVAALRGQLGSLQALLDDYKTRDAAANIQLQNLGSDLNAALARVAAEERKRATLEAAERKRAEAEATDLKKYRSEFFGRLRDVLGAQEGVRIVGDRFVFSSEVLFPPGGAELSRAGRGEVAKIADILRTIARDIPDGIDWVIQVDGHTDNVPLSGDGEYSDNWELSQARALSVVRYMANFLGIAPDRLSANGFGQYQPIASGDSENARAQNRRIELKFTGK